MLEQHLVQRLAVVGLDARDRVGVACSDKGRQIALQVVTPSLQECVEQLGRAGSRVFERVVEERADRAARDVCEPTGIGVQIMLYGRSRERIDGVALATGGSP